MQAQVDGAKSSIEKGSTSQGSALGAPAWLERC